MLFENLYQKNMYFKRDILLFFSKKIRKKAPAFVVKKEKQKFTIKNCKCYF